MLRRPMSKREQQRLSAARRAAVFIFGGLVLIALLRFISSRPARYTPEQIKILEGFSEADSAGRYDRP
jgi:hypothetical protein